MHTESRYTATLFLGIVASTVYDSYVEFGVFELRQDDWERGLHGSINDHGQVFHLSCLSHAASLVTVSIFRLFGPVQHEHFRWLIFPLPKGLTQIMLLIYCRSYLMLVAYPYSGLTKL